MSLPPQEPPRGPPPLNVSQKSHKVKKQQPPRPSAVASQSHQPPAPPPLEDYLASLEQQLVNELIPPVANTQSAAPMNEFPRARVGNMSLAELQRREKSLVTFLEQRRTRRRRSKEQEQMQQPDAWIDPFLELMSEELPPLPDNLLPLQNLLTPPPGLELDSTMSDTDRLLEFLRAGTDEEELQIEAFWEDLLKEQEKIQQQPNPPPPPVYLPPTPAAAASSFLPNPPPPPPRMFPVTASRSSPGPSESFPTAARGSIPGPSRSSTGLRGYHPTTSASRSSPVDPLPVVWRSIPILPAPPGYFPDKSGSFLPRRPLIPPAAGTSFLPQDISGAAAARSICPSPAGCSTSAPCASSEYSSAASLPPESSPDGSCSPLTVDSTPPPLPPPPPDPSA